MGTAPPVILHGKIRSGGSSGTPELVQKACQAWARHHADCSTCGVEDWYTPDESALCPYGRKLVRAWDAALRACLSPQSDD